MKITNYIFQKHIIILLLFTFFILFITSRFSPIFYTNGWSDINVYFTVGKSIINGKILYKDIFDHKGPLLLFLYSLGSLISQSSFIGMFFIQFIFWLILVFSLFKISNLFLNRNFSLLVCFLSLLILQQVIKRGGSAEEFILALTMLGMYFFIKYFIINEIKYDFKIMFIHGVIFASVLLIKINLVAIFIFPLLYIFIRLIYHREFKYFCLNALCFAGGILIILLPIFIYFYINEALSDFFDTYITFNILYSGEESLYIKVIFIIMNVIFFILNWNIIAFFSILGALYFPLKNFPNPLKRIVLILSTAMLFMSVFIGNFQEYHVISFLVITFLGIIACIQLLTYLSNIKINNQSLNLICIICLMIGLNNISKTETIFNRSNDFYTHAYIYNFQNIIQREKNPTLLIIGVSESINLFTVSNIVPNIKYFYTPNINHDVYPFIRKEQINYINEGRTQFIIIKEDYPGYLDEIVKNYTLILKQESIYNESSIYPPAINTYCLYKRKDL